jgi:hypothetical protein
VSRKKTLASDLRPLLDRLGQGDQGSTIVYVPTVKETLAVSNFMGEALREHGIECRCYHGSMSLPGTTPPPPVVLRLGCCPARAVLPPLGSAQYPVFLSFSVAHIHTRTYIYLSTYI